MVSIRLTQMDWTEPRYVTVGSWHIPPCIHKLISIQNLRKQDSGTCLFCRKCKAKSTNPSNEATFKSPPMRNWCIMKTFIVIYIWCFQADIGWWWLFPRLCDLVYGVCGTCRALCAKSFEQLLWLFILIQTTLWNRELHFMNTWSGRFVGHRRKLIKKTDNFLL